MDELKKLFSVSGPSFKVYLSLDCSGSNPILMETDFQD